MRQQLDIFEDSRDLMLHNDVLHALARRDAAAARAGGRKFAAEYPGDPRLAWLDILVDALGPHPQTAWTNAAEAEAAIAALQATVLPAARSVWPDADARAWAAPLWADLARRAAALPFDPARPQAHAAASWLNAGDAAEALAAARSIESWRRKPQPLAWAAEATIRSAGLDAAWPLIAELAWLAPARLARLIEGVADPLLTRLLRAFDADFDGADDSDGPAWFPAWVLTDKPALAHALGSAEPGQQDMPEQAFRLMLSLLELERQGRHADLIERRKRLLSLHAGLFRAYMKSR